MNICRIKNLNQKNRGFTLIELIVVVILIAIMAATVLPKILTSNGFEEYTYQAEVITKLRAIQLIAMQQTNSSKCHTVLVVGNALGIPANCTDQSAGWLSDTTSVVIDPQHNVSFDVSGGDYSFIFDGWGQPSCSACLITILGESTLTVTIESEGYIHEN